MADSEKPLVYLILGAAGSGRREVLVDLTESLADEGGGVAVLLSDAETASEADAKLPGLTHWNWSDGMVVAQWPAGATQVFFVTDGRSSPVDQLEALKPWIEAQGAEIARVLCVVNCQLAEQNPGLRAWYDACVHFSDVVLLNRREGVANKWLSDFQAHYKAQFLPCLFEFVKEGRVKNPQLVLVPEARRMSHWFDEEQDWVFTDAEGDEIEEDEESDSDEEVTVTAEVDPYFERHVSGRRVTEVPDIRKFLPA
ncbi:MAG: hypothetical protein JSS11_02190 [Verrucomicrobia bacterium]|nr:hypothetical protein [Verrucomicrobiota bacterium]